MLKKISFICVAFLASALMMGCEQKKTHGAAPASEQKGEIENGEHGALTPGQAPAQGPNKPS